jgi:hypothetical protein
MYQRHTKFKVTLFYSVYVMVSVLTFCNTSVFYDEGCDTHLLTSHQQDRVLLKEIKYIWRVPEREETNKK